MLLEPLLDRLFEVERRLRNFAAGELQQQIEAGDRGFEIIGGDRHRRNEDADDLQHVVDGLNFAGEIGGLEGLRRFREIDLRCIFQRRADLLYVADDGRKIEAHDGTESFLISTRGTRSRLVALAFAGSAPAAESRATSIWPRLSPSSLNRPGA